MNSKKARMLRKMGKVDKKDKRNYNKLSDVERKTLEEFYKFVEKRGKSK